MTFSVDITVSNHSDFVGMSDSLMVVVAWTIFQSGQFPGRSAASWTCQTLSSVCLHSFHIFSDASPEEMIR